MTIDQLVRGTPSYLTTDQCHIINSKEFPRTYINEKGKKLRIQSYFNGSIVVYNNKLLFCCRGDQNPWFKNIRLIFCELDDDFQPKKGTARFLEVGSHLDDKGRHGENRVEDPRLFVCDKKLHISYGDGYEIYHATFKDDLTIDRWKNVTNFKIGGVSENDYREKNWTPFDYRDFPHYVYYDNPRIIWCPFTKTAYPSEQRITWQYGPIRGGTPAIPYKDKFITFFHSCLLPGVSWRTGKLYLMGAYVFNRNPPFKVTHMTQVPLMRGEKLHKNPINETQHVIFPAGVVQNKDSFYVSLGINDSVTGVIRIQKTLIDSSLLPLKP